MARERNLNEFQDTFIDVDNPKLTVDPGERALSADVETEVTTATLPTTKGRRATIGNNGLRSAVLTIHTLEGV